MHPVLNEKIVKELRPYDIHIYKLANGVHEFDFKIEDTFFTLFDNSLIEKGELEVHVTLDKTDSMIQTLFHLEGSIKLICDRTLEPFDWPVSFDQLMIYKFGEESKELSEEVAVIPKETQMLNVADMIHEYLCLSIPMKKLHPKFENEDLEEGGEVIFSSHKEKTEENATDPRWDALKKLTNKK